MNKILIFNLTSFGGITILILYIVFLRIFKNRIKHINIHRIIYGCLTLLLICAIIVMITFNFDKVNGIKNEYHFNSGTYSGNIINNLPEGEGVFTNENGDLINGTFINGYAVGEGEITYKNGNFYKGFLSDNKPNGTGMLIERSGDGQDNSKINSIGQSSIEQRSIEQRSIEQSSAEKSSADIIEESKKISETIYEGDFINGILTGNGIITYPDKKNYIGEVKSFSANGYGITTFPDGSRYTGDHINDLFSGEGEFVCKSCGHIYKGEFQNNYMHGLGKLTTIDGFSSDGKWTFDKYNNKLFSCNNPFYLLNEQENKLKAESETSKSFKN